MITRRQLDNLVSVIYRAEEFAGLFMDHGISMNVSFDHEGSGEDLYGIMVKTDLQAQTIDPDCAVLIFNYYVAQASSCGDDPGP